MKVVATGPWNRDGTMGTCVGNECDHDQEWEHKRSPPKKFPARDFAHISMMANSEICLTLDRNEPRFQLFRHWDVVWIIVIQSMDFAKIPKNVFFLIFRKD
jgi:hypothetical protein